MSKMTHLSGTGELPVGVAELQELDEGFAHMGDPYETENGVRSLSPLQSGEGTT